VLEESAAYQQLIEDFNYTHDQVASRVGKSRTAVTNTLRLLHLPAAVQRLLAEGQISAGHARALLGTPDRAYQESLAKLIVTDSLNVRAVEELVRERSAADEPLEAAEGSAKGKAGATKGGTKPDPAEQRRLPPPGILELEELLSTHLNTRVKVEMTAKRGRVAVEFATLEDLERIYKLMVGGQENRGVSG